jgi:hypothetical protein
VDEAVTVVAAVVEAEAEVGDEVNKLNYEILRRYLAHSDLFAIRSQAPRTRIRKSLW